MNQEAAKKTPGIGRAINPLASLARHPRLALICFLLVVLASIPIAILKGQPKYFSTGAVQVSPRYMKNMTDDEELLFQSNTQFRQFVQQQVRTINRYDIIERVLNRPSPANPKMTLMQVWKTPAESPRQAIERLQREIRIYPVPDTYLISVSIEQGTPVFLDVYLNALMEEYVRTSRREQVYGADDRAKQLQDLETQLQTDLDKALADKSGVSQELGLSSVNTADGNPYNKVIEQVRLQLADAKLRAFDSQAKYDAFAALGETDIVTRSIEDAVLNDPGLNSFKASVNNRIAKLLTDISGLKNTHPAHIAATREVQELEAEVKTMTVKIRQEVHDALTKRYLVTRDQSKQLQDQLEIELGNLQKESAAYSARFNVALNLTERIEFLRAELTKVRNRLSFFQAEDNSFGLVRVVNPALPADMPIGLGKKKIILAFIVLAFMAAITLPTAIDLLDPRVFAPADMEKALGFASMGWVIDKVDPETDQFADDQLRRLATGIIRTADETGQQIFGIAGLKIGSGSTRTALDLANALEVIGKRVLVVEANAYRSANVRVFRGRTIAQATLVEMLQGTSLDNAGLPEQAGMVVCGTKAMERNLPDVESLHGVLLGMAKRFDVVLVDSPPLLLSADSELVARATQNIILVVEAERTVKKELVQARRILERINPQSVGSVLNRVSPENGFGGLNAQLQEFVTGQRQTGPGVKQQAKAAIGALMWELSAFYAWVRWTVIPMFALPEKYYQEEENTAATAQNYSDIQPTGKDQAGGESSKV